MSPRVLLISQEYPPTIGGAGSVAMNNHYQLLEAGLDVSLITSNNKKNWMMNMAFDIWLKLISSNHNKMSLIINDLGSILVCGLFLPKSKLEKSVMYLHGSEFEIINKESKGWLKTKLLKYSIIRVIKHSKNIVCVSNYMKYKFFLEGGEFIYDINFVDKKTKVIYTVKNCIGVTNTQQKESFQKYDIKFVTVSRLEKKKGFDVKLKIFEELRSKGLKLKWDIVGGGGYFNEFNRLIIDKGLSDVVILHGILKPLEFSNLLSSSDIFWLLSDYKESFGLVYLEAHQYGIPTIGYNRCGVKEIIIEGVNGYLVNDSKEVIDIINDFDVKKFDKKNIKESTFRFNKYIERQKLLDCL